MKQWEHNRKEIYSYHRKSSKLYVTPNAFEVIQSNRENPPCGEADCCVSDETRNRKVYNSKSERFVHAALVLCSQMKSGIRKIQGSNPSSYIENKKLFCVNQAGAWPSSSPKASCRKLFISWFVATTWTGLQRLDWLDHWRPDRLEWLKRAAYFKNLKYWYETQILIHILKIKKLA